MRGASDPPDSPNSRRATSLLLITLLFALSSAQSYDYFTDAQGNKAYAPTGQAVDFSNMRLASDRDGHWAAVFEVKLAGLSRIYSALSYDNGVSYRDQKPVKADGVPTGYDEFSSNIIYFPSKSAFVTCWSSSQGAPGFNVYVASMVLGQNWTVPRLVNNDPQGPYGDTRCSMTAIESTLYIAWWTERGVNFTSCDADLNCLPSKSLDTRGFTASANPSSGPSLTSSVGCLTVVYANTAQNGQEFQNDVYMIRSCDNGTTWTAPDAITTLAVGDGVGSVDSACDPDSDILGVIYDIGNSIIQSAVVNLRPTQTKRSGQQTFTATYYDHRSAPGGVQNPVIAASSFTTFLAAWQNTLAGLLESQEHSESLGGWAQLPKNMAPQFPQGYSDFTTIGLASDGQFTFLAGYHYLNTTANKYQTFSSSLGRVDCFPTFRACENICSGRRVCDIPTPSPAPPPVAVIPSPIPSPDLFPSPQSSPSPSFESSPAVSPSIIPSPVPSPIPSPTPSPSESFPSPITNSPSPSQGPSSDSSPSSFSSSPSAFVITSSPTPTLVDSPVSPPIPEPVPLIGSPSSIPSSLSSEFSPSGPTPYFNPSIEVSPSSGLSPSSSVNPSTTSSPSSSPTDSPSSFIPSSVPSSSLTPSADSPSAQPSSMSFPSPDQSLTTTPSSLGPITTPSSIDPSSTPPAPSDSPSPSDFVPLSSSSVDIPSISPSEFSPSDIAPSELGPSINVTPLGASPQIAVPTDSPVIVTSDSPGITGSPLDIPPNTGAPSPSPTGCRLPVPYPGAECIGDTWVIAELRLSNLNLTMNAAKVNVTGDIVLSYADFRILDTKLYSYGNVTIVNSSLFRATNYQDFILGNGSIFEIEVDSSSVPPEPAIVVDGCVQIDGEIAIKDRATVNGFVSVNYPLIGSNPTCTDFADAVLTVSPIEDCVTANRPKFDYPQSVLIASYTLTAEADCQLISPASSPLYSTFAMFTLLLTRYCILQ